LGKSFAKGSLDCFGMLAPFSSGHASHTKLGTGAYPARRPPGARLEPSVAPRPPHGGKRAGQGKKLRFPTRKLGTFIKKLDTPTGKLKLSIKKLDFST
jgi:hypothetical protein